MDLADNRSKGIIRKFFRYQVALCKRFDQNFFSFFSIDGNTQFSKLASELVLDGSEVADVGAGKTPFFGPSEVLARRLKVTGVDISAEELSEAPPRAYDAVMVSALEKCRGNSNHDFVIAQSVLEHVFDGSAAMVGIASLMRPGGKVITFCPNRRAWFAQLNLLLPEGVKRGVLFYIFPEKKDRQGFPAHYSGCTPGEMRANMRAAGIDPIETRHYFVSSYFMFFFPLYLVWRIITCPFMYFLPDLFCETFIIVGGVSAGDGKKGAS